MAVCAWPSGALARAVTVSADHLVSVLTPELFQHKVSYLLILGFLYKDILETLGIVFYQDVFPDGLRTVEVYAVGCLKCPDSGLCSLSRLSPVKLDTASLRHFPNSYRLQSDFKENIILYYIICNFMVSF